MRLKHPGEGTHPIYQETFELNCSSTSLALDSTLVVVVEMSLSVWLVCAAETIAQETPAWHHDMVRKLATIHGLGGDTADMLVSEVFYHMDCVFAQRTYQ